MAMEVGVVRARIVGDTGDFDKKMADAQKTFEVTAQKLDASAQQVANSLKKTYSDRVVAANAAASKEIAAAQRSMRERLRLTTSSAEISAVRQQFAQRADAARVGARAEIQAAQQQYLAASQGMRPVIAVSQQMATTAALTTSQFSKLRTATVAVANAAAGANPVFARMSAVFGAMSGTGGTVALAVAGIVALGFAYNKLTKAAKEAQKAQEDAIDAARKIRMGPLASEIEQKQAAETLRDRLTAELATERKGRKVTILDDRGSITETIINEKAIRKLEADLAEAEKAVKTFGGVITTFNTEAQQDAAEASDRTAEAAERAAKEFEKWRIIVKDLDEEMGRFLTDLLVVTDRMNKLAGRGAAPRPGLTGPTTTRAGGVVGRGAGLIGTSLDRLNAMRAARTPESGGGIGAMLKAQLDPKQLITSIASGGVSAMIGAASNFATGLLTHAKRAKEALRLHMEAVNDWDRSLRAAIASLRGESEKARTFAAIDDIAQMFKGLAETFKVTTGPIPVFDTMDQLVEWLKNQQSLIAKLKDAFPFLNFDEFSERLDQLIKYAAELGISLGKTSDAAKSATESMTNVPSGFKVFLARFQATAPAFPASSLPTLPPPSTVNAGGGGGGTQTTASTVNIETVIVNGVEDLPDFIEKLEVEVARKVARGGSGLTLGYL